MFSDTQYVVRDWQLDIDVDMVLRGQGADPDVLRQRKPRLIEIAERAVREGRALIEPAVAYRTMQVEALTHERLTLSGGAHLSGALLTQQLSPAQSITLIVCTIGPALEQRVSMLLRDDPALGFALDGFGSVAVEALGVAICSRLEAQAHEEGHYTSIPLSPGLIGWSVSAGQRQIFGQIDAAPIGITLNDSAQMTPHKSTSIILGRGPAPFGQGKTCDFCALRGTCRYQDHYALVGNQA
jgi:hypothetical protein